MIVIPNFKGEVYSQDSPDYAEKKKQYATSSYPVADMSPFLVTYPTDHRDIASALKFAKNTGKNIVVRSGGHQYCGLSSGDTDVIVLSMDKFNRCDATDNIVTVGVGCLLTDFAQFMTDHGLALPHGECPRVAIGGHVQTGGYGHLLRSFGLCLDHCRAFDIVLPDGTLTTVYRPTTDDNDNDDDEKTDMNDELFWAVMGGNPGSFGVLTELEFVCIRDSDHPHSSGVSYMFWYQAPVLKAVLEAVAEWTRMVADGDTDLPPDVDLCISAVSKAILFFPNGGVILLEMVYANVGGASQDYDPSALFQPIVEAALAARTTFAVKWKFFDGEKRLSFMNNSFVRRVSTTSDGREFAEPYKKSLHCTKNALTQEFVDSFVDEVTKVMSKDNGLKVVVQMFIGGGAYVTNDIGQTSISHRDIVHGLVYDIFYEDGKEEDAIAAQARAEKKWFSESQGLYSREKIYMTWGSFGDTRIENVWPYYYDSEEQYNRLRAIKAKVDPENIFHNEFTLSLYQWC